MGQESHNALVPLAQILRYAEENPKPGSFRFQQDRACFIDHAVRNFLPRIPISSISNDEMSTFEHMSHQLIGKKLQPGLIFSTIFEKRIQPVLVVCFEIKESIPEMGEIIDYAFFWRVSFVPIEGYIDVDIDKVPLTLTKENPPVDVTVDDAMLERIVNTQVREILEERLQDVNLEALLAAQLLHLQGVQDLDPTAILAEKLSSVWSPDFVSSEIQNIINERLKNGEMKLERSQPRDTQPMTNDVLRKQVNIFLVEWGTPLLLIASIVIFALLIGFIVR